MHFFKRKMVGFIVVGLMVLAAPAVVFAADKVITLRMAHNHSEKGMYYKGTLEFIRLVEKNSQGRIKVEHYPAGQLGADRDLQEGVQIGTVDIGISSSPVALIDDYMKLLDAPYLFVNRQHVTKVLDGPIGKKLATPLEKLGIQHIGYWENGYRQITNNARAIHKPEDLQGIKLRTPENTVRMATFKTLGANPVPMSFKEVFGACQQGVIDGQENPLSTIYQASLHEVQKYLSITNHVYSPAHVLMRKAKFDALPADLQKVLLDAGREVAVFTRNIGEQNDKELAGKMASTGMKVNDADISAFVEKAKPVWKQITGKNKFKDAETLMQQIADMAP